MTAPLAFRYGPALARCSLVGCGRVMPGESMTGIESGSVVFVQNVAPGWVAGRALLASGDTHLVLLCPKHAHLFGELENGTVN